MKNKNKYNIGDLFTNGFTIFYIHEIEYDKFRKMNYYHFMHMTNGVAAYLAECEMDTAIKKQTLKHYRVKDEK
jgi:hypothetical protein